MNKNIGKCYQLCGRFVMDNDVILVHGRLINPGPIGFKTLKHAWIEKGNKVIDLVMDKEFTRNRYYRRFKAKTFKRYTSKEACNLMLTTEHFGPWKGRRRG